MASDMLFHAWENPSCVSDICVHWSTVSAPPQLALCQPGAVALMEACPDAGLRSVRELVAFDCLRRAFTIPLPRQEGGCLLVTVTQDWTISFLAPGEPGGAPTIVHSTQLDAACFPASEIVPSLADNTVFSQPVLMDWRGCSAGSDASKATSGIFCIAFATPGHVLVLTVTLQFSEGGGAEHELGVVKCTSNWRHTALPIRGPPEKVDAEEVGADVVEAVEFVPQGAAWHRPGLNETVAQLAVLVSTASGRKDLATYELVFARRGARRKRAEAPAPSAPEQPLSAWLASARLQVFLGPWVLFALHESTTIVQRLRASDFMDGFTNEVWQPAMPGSAAGADHKRRTGLLVISRQEAAVFPTEGADKALLCRTALPLVADVVACVPLGAGTFCIVAADGGVALLQLAAWNGGLRGSALLCTLEDAADAPGGRVSSARTCSSSDRAQSDARDGGAMDVDASEKGSSGSCPEGGRHSPQRPAHISAANVLPLPEDSEKWRDTFGLLILGTFAGPAQVVALPRNLIEHVRSGGTPATRALPVLHPRLVDALGPVQAAVAVRLRDGGGTAGSDGDALITASGAAHCGVISRCELAAQLFVDEVVHGALPHGSLSELRWPENAQIDAGTAPPCLALTSAVPPASQLLASRGGALETVELAEFEGGVHSLCVACTAPCTLLQVTAARAALVDTRGGGATHEWRPPGGGRVTSAACGGDLIAAIQSTTLHLLCSTNGRLREVGHETLSAESTGVAVLRTPPFDEDLVEDSAVLAVGLRTSPPSVVVLDLDEPAGRASYSCSSLQLPDGGSAASFALLPDALPDARMRTLAIGTIAGDVHLVSIASLDSTPTLRLARTVSVGSTHVELRPLSPRSPALLATSSSALLLRAAPDAQVAQGVLSHPVVAPVPAQQPTAVCTLPDGRVAWTTLRGDLVAGTLDEQLRLRRRSRPVAALPRALAYCASTDVVACQMVQCASGHQGLELIEPLSLRTVLTQPLAQGHEIDALACALLPTLDATAPPQEHDFIEAPRGAQSSPPGEPPPLPTVAHGSRVAALHDAERTQRFTCCEHVLQASTVYRVRDSADRLLHPGADADVVHLLTVYKPRIERFPGEARVRYHLDIMAVLQLAGPCLAVADVLPEVAPPKAPPKSPPKAPSQFQPARGSAAAAADAPEPPPCDLPPPPLLVVGAPSGLLLLEVVSDPWGEEAADALDAAASKIAADEAAARANSPDLSLGSELGSGIGVQQSESDRAEAQAAARRRRANLVSPSRYADAAFGDAPAAQAWRAVAAADEGSNEATPAVDTAGAGAVWGSAGWQPAPGSVGLDMARDWRQRVQVREHDTASLAGNGIVHDVRTHDNRVFALELFGTVTLLDTVWTCGCRHAALIPVATFREQAWVQACVPMGRCTVAAALHAHTLAVLHLDEYLNRCKPAEHPQGRGPAPLRNGPPAPIGPAGFDAPLAMLPQAREGRAAGMDAYNDPRAAEAAGADDAILPADHPLDVRGANHGLDVALTAVVRQSVTALTRMRVPGGGSEVVAYGTAAGGLGCLQAAGRPAARAGSRLQDALRLDALDAVIGRASGHTHAATWSACSFADPYTDERPWATGVATAQPYWATKPGGLVAQKAPLDVSRLHSALERLEASGVWPQVAAEGSEAAASELSQAARQHMREAFDGLSAAQRHALGMLRCLGTEQAGQVLAWLTRAA